MTGILMDVKRMAVHDGPGLRTTLFLKGCPLSCLWCHNPEGQRPKPEIGLFPEKCIGCGKCREVCPNGTAGRAACIVCGACASVCTAGARKLYGREITLDEALRIALEDRIFYGSTGGVTLSGGEPLMQADFAAALLRELCARGVHTAVDTCGHAPWSAFEKTLPYCGLYLFDVKHMDSEKHRAATGRGNGLILENLARLSAAGARIQVRIPLIPGINDDEENILRTGEFLKKIGPEKIKLLPYHDMAHVKYRAIGMEDTLPARPEDMMERLHRSLDLLKGMNLPAYSDQ
ncbi:MAG: glycyl-radical enzyme activating protein [Clostridia bacterium]|nr:glycyl-radical enzyme activating protein [Clostridia bacterium]